MDQFAWSACWICQPSGKAEQSRALRSEVRQNPQSAMANCNSKRANNKLANWCTSFGWLIVKIVSDLTHIDTSWAQPATERSHLQPSIRASPSWWRRSSATTTSSTKTAADADCGSKVILDLRRKKKQITHSPQISFICRSSRRSQRPKTNAAR